MKTSSSSSAGDELSELGKKISKIGKELLKCVDDVENIDPKQVKKVTKMMKECSLVISKKNRELIKMWAKIEQEEEKSKTEN